MRGYNSYKATFSLLKGGPIRGRLVNCPFISSNISSIINVWSLDFTTHTLFQGFCPEQYNFLRRAQLLTTKLLKQGYVAPWLKSSLQKVYDNHHELIDRSEYIHISNVNESLPLYIKFFFLLSSTRLFPVLTIYMTNTAGVL